MKENRYNKSKIFLQILFFTLLMVINGSAQSIINYNFTPSVGTYTPITGDTLALSGGSADDGWYNNIPIGFTFYYMGNAYNNVSASTNGWLTFDQILTTAVNSNNLATGTQRPIIAPLWDDNKMDIGNVVKTTTGTAPNRVFTIQYTNLKWNYNATAGVVSFQVNLYEANKSIEFIYNPESGSVNSGSASVGINGVLTGPGNFQSISALTSTATSSSLTEVTSIAAKPEAGLTFKFTPAGFTTPEAPINFTITVLTASSLSYTFQDNSTNESHFEVMKSTDSTNWSLLQVIPSTSFGTIGTTYTVSLSNLLPGTKFYYKITAKNEASPPSLPLYGSATTLLGTLSGTKSVGPTGVFTSLTAALTAVQEQGLAGSVILELQAAYTSSTEIWPLNFTSLTTDSLKTLTIRPASDAVNLTIAPQTDYANALVFDGGSYVTIDGRPSGTGTNVELTIENWSTTATSVLLLKNDASNNTFKYLKLRAKGTSVVNFSTTTGVTGNDNNVIEDCNISESVNVQMGIYSVGTAGKENSNNIIRNNNIFNFFSAASASYGINLGAGNTNWTIENNSFYQTATRTSTAGNTHYGIYIGNSAGGGYIINGNKIGGSSPNAEGGAWTINGGFANRFQGISLNVSTTNPSSVQGNIISNINLTSTSGASTTPGVFCGINLAAGSAEIGTVTGNVIGSGTATDAIVATISTTGGYSMGVVVTAGTGATVNFKNNIIGGITILGSTTSIGHSFRAIENTTGGTINISNNLIGSYTTANSINLGTATGGTILQEFSGFRNTSGSPTIVLYANEIANIKNATTSTSASSITRGFVNAAGIVTINYNRIRDMVTSSAGIGTSASASLMGISFSGSAGTFSVLGNQIYNLTNLSSTGAVNVVGIAYASTSTTPAIFNANLIHSLNSSSTGIAAIRGINITGGVGTYSNNIIRLGVDGAGADNTLNHDIIGINETVGTDNFYFNSVYIGGANAVSGAQNTFAFSSTVTVNNRNIKNNIFVNSRTNNSPATGKHYAVAVGGTTTNPTGLSMGNNLYNTFSGSPIGRFSAVDYNTLTEWQIAIGTDGNSGFGNPNFINPNGNSSNVNLHIMSPSPIEGNGISLGTVVTDDFDGDLRNTNTPVDIGADAGNFTSIDIFPPQITYAPLVSTGFTTDRIFSATINDATGVPTSGTLVPRVYYKKGLNGSYFSKPGTLGTGTAVNGEWSFTISAADLGGLVTTDTVFYYVIAQDNLTPTNISSNPVGALATDVNTITTHPVKPNSYNIFATLAGVKTIGTGGDFATLKDAFTAFGTATVTGNLTLEIISDTLTETAAAVLNSFIIEGGEFTVTIKPAAGKQPLVTGNIATSLIKLNGADNVIIDGSNNGSNTKDLTLVNTNTSSGTAVIWLSSLGPGNGATFNTIKNCNIAAGAPQNTSTNNTYGIIACGTSISIGAGADNDYNYYYNNNIYKVRYGIVSYGESAANPNMQTAINNNIIGPSAFGPDEIGRGGIVLANERQASVIQNEVRFVGGDYANTSGGSDRVGIALETDALWPSTSSSITISTISRNIIHDVVEERTFSAAGLVVANNDVSVNLEVINNINNNVIYNIKGNSTGADQTVGIGYSAGLRDAIMYNTVYMTGDVDPNSSATNPSTPGFAFIISSATDVVTPMIRNNSFHMDLSSSSTTTIKFGAVSIPTGFNIGTGYSDYNNAFINPANTLCYVGNIGGGSGTFYQTLDTWKSAITTDQNSISGEPSYASSTNLYPDLNDPKAWNLNGRGLPEFITLDFNGQSRSDSVETGPTDIGAFEYTPLSIPNNAVESAPPALNTTTNYFVAGMKIVTINWPSAGTIPSSVAFKYYSGANPPSVVNGRPINAYWTFTAPGTVEYPVQSIKVFYNPNTLGTIQWEKNIRFAVLGQNETVWQTLIDTAFFDLDTVENSITLVGVNIGSATVTLTDVNDPVPVELASFTASAKDRDVVLNWNTATETNTNNFLVQRKLVDDKDWVEVSTLKAKGNSTEKVQYSFADKKLNTGKYSYRLKIVDLDGKYAYSPEVEVEVGVPTVFALSQNYPNPFNPTTKIDYQLPAASKVMIEMYNITGERVAQLVNEEQNPGYYTVTVNQLNEMASGVYIYRIIAVDKLTGKNFINTKKMMLLK
ncbi:MAG TPA: T9SS type A sorting domain-containing protein [Ignavibacteriaceae bacterium]|nr:T9SS type A sorting domain-containing protein [Ignavibacteriaceae bacterium]